jgi:hypothetical protein
MMPDGAWLIRPVMLFDLQTCRPGKRNATGQNLAANKKAG